MYQNAALLALLAFAYALASGRVERSRLSGPIVFVAAGVLLGPHVFGALALELDVGQVRVLAELTLAMVLFSDAARANLALIRSSRFLPRRLLGLGLPLTVILGFLIARALFPWLSWLELALLAAVLAPTDAALGKPVVTNPAVPGDLREALNVESGLNDGICVPLVVVLLEAAAGTETAGRPLAHVLGIVVEEIGIGVAVGLALAVPAAALLRRATAAGRIAHAWRGVPVVALALASFALAQEAGGSGFIACFVGGLAFGARHGGAAALDGAEGVGEALAFATWVTFGAVVVWAAEITPRALAYALLSLTLARMAPVWLALAGTPVAAADRLFIGWFGPRGLASIVFGVMALDAGLPNGETIASAVVATVLLSVVLHGMTANALVRARASAWAGREEG